MGRTGLEGIATTTFYGNFIICWVYICFHYIYLNRLILNQGRGVYAKVAYFAIPRSVRSYFFPLSRPYLILMMVADDSGLSNL